MSRLATAPSCTTCYDQGRRQLLRRKNGRRAALLEANICCRRAPFPRRIYASVVIQDLPEEGYKAVPFRRRPLIPRRQRRICRLPRKQKHQVRAKGSLHGAEKCLRVLGIGIPGNDNLTTIIERRRMPELPASNARISRPLDRFLPSSQTNRPTWENERSMATSKTSRSNPQASRENGAGGHAPHRSASRTTQ